ncbi:MAG: hypothetical protein ACTSRS_14850 [Candidatus Helarchaeota archaeon]
MEPFYGLFNFSIGLLFFLIIPFIIPILKKNYRAKEWYGVGSISGCLIICCIVGGYYIVKAIEVYFASFNFSDPLDRLIFVQEGFYRSGLYPYPWGSFVLYACLFFITAIMVNVIWQNRFSARVSLASTSPGYTNSVDLEISRKVFHIALIGVLVLYFGLGEMLTTNIHLHFIDIFPSEKFVNFIPYSAFPYQNYTPWGGQIFTIFAFTVIFFFMLFSEFIRLYHPKYDILKTMARTWRKKEQGTFGPQVYTMLGGLVPALFFTPPIAAVAIIIGAIGDASATIIGVTKGKHRIRATSKKTWEGCIAGFLGSFICGFVIYLAIINLAGEYGALYQGTILGGAILAFGGALTFLIVDFLDPPINDNLLNPICAAIVMLLISILIK